MGLFDKVTSMWSQDMAIDLGTANTIIYYQDKVVVDQPSIVAKDIKTGKAVAIGRLAQQMQGKTHKNIETILENIKDKKYVVPENFMFKEARRLFKEPEVIDTNNLELKSSKPNDEGVIDFLVKEKSFNEERVRNALARIKKAKAGVASQNRLESVFGVATVKSSTFGKRKEPEKKKGSKEGGQQERRKC